MSNEQSIKERRSMVRVWVTRAAAAYIFGGSAALIIVAFAIPDSAGLSTAKDIFLSVLPVGTGIVTYWFANRASRANNDHDGQNDKDTN